MDQKVREKYLAQVRKARERKVDKALLSKSAPGGIDLRRGKLHLEREGTVTKFDVSVNSNNFETSIEGLVPVIINITPIMNLQLFLSAKRENKNVELSSVQ